jgi:hypothetical protein
MRHAVLEMYLGCEKLISNEEIEVQHKCAYRVQSPPGLILGKIQHDLLLDMG